MEKQPQKITGILLAGGKSSRMGVEKGNVLLGGKFLYQYPLAVLESLCDEILISTCKELSMQENYEQVCDEIPNIGPIGGVYTCLKKSANDINIVVSYDLPNINRELFLYLIENLKDADLALPSSSIENIEPLCGIYRKSVTEILKNRIDEQKYAMQKILPFVKNQIVSIEEDLPFYSPSLFANINDQNDLDKLSSF